MNHRSERLLSPISCWLGEAEIRFRADGQTSTSVPEETSFSKVRECCQELSWQMSSMSRGGKMLRPMFPVAKASYATRESERT